MVSNPLNRGDPELTCLRSTSTPQRKVKTGRVVGWFKSGIDFWSQVDTLPKNLTFSHRTWKKNPEIPRRFRTWGFRIIFRCYVSFRECTKIGRFLARWSSAQILHTKGRSRYLCLFRHLVQLGKDININFEASCSHLTSNTMGGSKKDLDIWWSKFPFLSKYTPAMLCGTQKTTRSTTYEHWVHETWRWTKNKHFNLKVPRNDGNQSKRTPSWHRSIVRFFLPVEQTRRQGSSHVFGGAKRRIPTFIWMNQN